ncbi:hypothetical protein D3C73_947860 [compost metagenome]
MASVTGRIEQIKQPRGGYLKPKDFVEILLDDGVELYPEKNIHAGLIGSVIDYMTRYTMRTSTEKALNISLLSASIFGEREDADFFLSRVRGLDDLSIRFACKLVGYDVCT